MNQYEVIASACTTIYVILEQLSNLNHFYRFSLDYFQEIFKLVLASHSRNTKAPDDRINYLVNQLYVTTFQWTSRSLLHRDHLVLGLLLAQAASLDIKNGTFAALLSAKIASNGKDVAPSRIEYANENELDSDELENVVGENRPGWTKFLQGSDGEMRIPVSHDSSQRIISSTISSNNFRSFHIGYDTGQGLPTRSINGKRRTSHQHCFRNRFKCSHGL